MCVCALTNGEEHFVELPNKMRLNKCPESDKLRYGCARDHPSRQSELRANVLFVKPKNKQSQTERKLSECRIIVFCSFSFRFFFRCHFTSGKNWPPKQVETIAIGGGQVVGGGGGGEEVKSHRLQVFSSTLNETECAILND